MCVGLCVVEGSQGASDAIVGINFDASKEARGITRDDPVLAWHAWCRESLNICHLDLNLGLTFRNQELILICSVSNLNSSSIIPSEY